MKPGDTIEFEMPRTREFRTGRVEGFVERNGIEMPTVTDHQDNEYPVNPDNITEVHRRGGC